MEVMGLCVGLEICMQDCRAYRYCFSRALPCRAGMATRSRPKEFATRCLTAVRSTTTTLLAFEIADVVVPVVLNRNIM